MPDFKLDTNYKVVTDSDSDADDDDIANMKRKSLIMIEQSLDSPCDVSPLCPRTMKEAEKPGLNIEKLLLERVMLRKELRLRSVQEMLVETSHKLEKMEAKVEEYERLPMFRQYVAWCGLVRCMQEAGSGGAGVVRRLGQTSWNFLYQLMLAILGLPVYLFHQLPSSLQLICMSVVAHLASVVGESAENYTNECRERSSGVSDDNQVQPARTRRNRQGSRRSNN